MKPLSAEEISALLKTQCPEEIVFREGARLDAAGLAVLAEKARDVAETHGILKESGRRFRESLPPVPLLKLSPEPVTSGLMTWIGKPVSMPAGLLGLAAAGLFGFTALLFLYFSGTITFRGKIIGDSEAISQTRNSATHDERLKLLNAQLFQALMRRGMFLLDLGIKEANRDFMEEALNDFVWARELKPADERVLEYLAMTYHALGNRKMLKEIQAIRERNIEKEK